MSLRHPIIDPELKRICGHGKNKVCADCEQLGPQFVDLTHGVFICNNCTAVHKSMGFKIKGVQNSLFTTEEVDFLARTGNDAFNNLYLALLTAEDITEMPSQHTEDRSHLATFIRSKYIERKWFVDKGDAHTQSESESVSPMVSPRSHSGSGKTNSIYQNVLANRSFYNRSAKPTQTADKRVGKVAIANENDNNNDDVDASNATERDSQRDKDGEPHTQSENKQKPPIARRIQSSPAMTSAHTHTHAHTLSPSPSVSACVSPISLSPSNSVRLNVNTHTHTNTQTPSRPHSFTGKGFVGLSFHTQTQPPTHSSAYPHNAHTQQTQHTSYRTPSPSLSAAQSLLLADDSHYPGSSHVTGNNSISSHLSYTQHIHTPHAHAHSANNSVTSYAQNPFAVTHTSAANDGNYSERDVLLARASEENERLNNELESERKRRRELEVKLREANRKQSDQEQILSALQAQSQGERENLQRTLDLYRAKRERLQELDVRECEILERELLLSLRKIAEHKQSKQQRQMFIAEDQLCIVCLSQRKTVMLMPCRHFCLCQPCAEAMPVNVCPVCKAVVTQKALTTPPPPPPSS